LWTQCLNAVDEDFRLPSAPIVLDPKSLYLTLNSLNELLLLFRQFGAKRWTAAHDV